MPVVESGTGTGRTGCTYGGDRTDDTDETGAGAGSGTGTGASFLGEDIVVGMRLGE